MKKTGNRLTKKQKAEIEAGRVIASEIGIDVKYVVNFQDENGKNVGMIDPVTGKISGANGEISFREETGKIEMILDINAGLSNFTTKEGQASILRAMSHELTHFIEKMSPRMYQDLQEFMIQNIDFGEDSFHGLVAQKMESLKIGETQAVREVIANACETMLGDSDVMEKLYRQNAKLGDRILNWLSEKIEAIDRAIEKIRAIFKTASEGDTAQFAESKALTANLDVYKQALQKWETALLDAAQNYQNGGLVQSGDSAQYSIRYTTDNKPVVVVQEDILDGVPKSQWVKTVKDTISGKFANGIPVKGRLVKVNAVTRNEYMNSKYTKRMFKSGNNIYADKLKSANNLDEIILASTNYINEDLKHVRKDNFKEFARGDILLRVGNHDYSAKVIIGITPKNNMVLYDIINFTQTSISLKNKRDSRKGYAESRKPKGYAESRKPMPDGVSFDSSISQNDSDVNNQYMQNRGKNSEQSVKYSEREYSYEVLTAKPDMKVTQLKPIHDSDMKKYLKDRNLFVQEMMKRAKQGKNPKNTDTQTYLYCDDLEADILITRESFRHGAERYGAEYVKICSSISDILKTSIVVNELLPRETTKGGYVLLGLAESENTYNLVRSVVNNKTWKLTDYDVLSAIKKSGIKKEDVEQLNVLRITSNSEGSSPSSVISIADFLNFVKSQNLANSVFSDDVLKNLKENRGSDSLSKSVVYSEREADPNPMRTRLSHIMEDAAIGKKERALIKEYQKQNENIKNESNELYQLYKELNVYYKEAVDSNQTYRPALDQDYRRHLEEQISSLQEKIKEKELRIKFVGRRLLQLKAMQPIQDIIEKDKRAAAEEHKKKVFEKEYREKKIRRIQATVKRINRLLTKPNGTKNVKDGLQKESMKFMQTFLNNTSVFNKKQLERLSEFYKKIDGGEEVNTGNTGVYNEDIQNTIDQLKQTIAGKRLSQLSKEELEKTGELVDHFSHIIKTENEVFIMISRIRVDSFSKIWYNKK